MAITSGIIRSVFNARQRSTLGQTGVTIAPFNRPPNSAIPTPVGGDFSATPIFGKQGPITITFSKPIDFISITAKNSSVDGNVMVAFDANGKEVNRVEFGKGISFKLFTRRVELGEFQSTRRIETANIHRIELRPASDEQFIFWGDFKFREQDPALTKEDFGDETVDLPPRPENIQLSIPLQFRNIRVPGRSEASINLLFDIKPAIPAFNRSPDVTSTGLEVRPLPIDMELAIDNIALELTKGKVESFFDPDRELKTVVNFGNDFQTLLTNWQRDLNNLEDHAILVKLYRPLPVDIDTKELVWISRELTPSWLDTIFVKITEEAEIIFFLRPPNKNTETAQLFGREVSNVTLLDLIPSGAIQTSGSTVILSDSILEKFFTTDVAGVELNVDYADYNNFVHFSSAENRLIAFREKLLQVESLDQSLALQAAAASASLESGSLTDISGTFQFKSMQQLVEDRQVIVRGLDGYERFLFFDTGSFSGSLSGLVEDTILVRDDVSWPKTSGVVLAVTSSASLAFFDTQTGIASDFDNLNQEALRNNVPLYLQNDPNSAEFITFLNMVGHLFDTIKLYIDDMPTIWDRDPSPDRGLPKDLLWQVADSLGIKLPNQYAIKELLDFTVGTATVTQETYRQAIAETWKRFIHNQVFIAKAKGTRTGLNALLNTYGVLPELVRVRESATPSSVFATSSFELFDELTRVIQFNSGASITMPFSASGLFSPATIECRFAASPGTGSFTSSMIMQGAVTSAVPLAQSWSVVLRTVGSAANQRGQLFLLDGAGTTVVTSSVDKFYNGDFYTVMLRQAESGSAVDFFVKRFEDDVFEFEFEASVTTGSITASFQTPNIVLGSGAATSSNDIRIDEFRLWSEVLTDETFNFHVQFPGMYAGNDFDSSNEKLVVRHSFGIPQNLAATASVPNESPFVNSASVADGFTSIASFPFNYLRTTRQTKRFTPNAGGSQFSSAKITIAPSASFRPDGLTTTGSATFPVLSRDKSILKTCVERKDDLKPDTRVGMYFTLAETINDSILRSLGNVDLNDLMGDPLNLYIDIYPELISRNLFYKRNLAPTFDQNDFVRSVENLLDGLFQHSKTIVPIGTKLLTGIVVEPPMLERSRFRLNRPLSIDGAGTRLEESASIIRAASGSLPGTRNVDAFVGSLTSSMSAIDSTVFADVSGTLNIPIQVLVTPLNAEVVNVTQSLAAIPSFVNTAVDLDDLLDVSALDLSNETLIDVISDILPSGILTLLQPSIFVTESINILAEVPMTDMVLDLDVMRTLTAITQSFLSPEIKSANDLSDPINTTYFTHPSGSFAIKSFRRTRTRENILRDRGAWAAGTTYKENDFAVVSGSEYRCLTTRVLSPGGTPVNFVSNIPPNLDTANWTNVVFITTIVPQLMKAVITGSSRIGSGSVAIVPFDRSAPPTAVFQGYSQNHYKFFRPTYTAYIRSRFTGVKQTVDTTTDGKPPIEVLLSSDAQLFVKDGSPRQTARDEAGPILEVRPNETGSV